MSKKIKQHWSDILFDWINHIFLFLMAMMAIIPFIYIIAGSFATETELKTRAFFLIPSEFTLEAYVHIFNSDSLIRGLFVSVYVTVIGTMINLFFTVTMSYGLSKRNLIGRSFLMKCILFTMLFPPGMIPAFLVVRNLGMLNTYWALWLTGATNAFSVVVIKNFFEQLPFEIEESAMLEGATAMQILWKIVIPLSGPVIATFALFFAVGHWNSYFGALLYLRDNAKMPIQVILRQIVILSQGLVENLDDMQIYIPAQSLKMAVIVVATVPILCVYPFLQKHFVKGVLIGSIK